MFRRSLFAFAAAADKVLLFGSAKSRTPEQRKIYKQLQQTTIEAAFPHIAACWVGPCWGTVMQTPANLAPICAKRAVWRCSQCHEEFEMGISKFINEGGVCPVCHKQQKRRRRPAEGGAKGKAAAAAGDEAETYERAPRMIHSNYQSVLYTNAEWETKNVQPMLAQRWELVSDQLLQKSAAGESVSLLASPKIDGIRCMVGYNKAQKNIVFFSRGGIVLECCHGIEQQLEPLFARDPTLMLDGELFAPECNFEQLNGFVRRLRKTSTPEVRLAQDRLLEYFAFDIMYSQLLSAPDAPFEERYRLLKQLIPTCGAKRISNYVHDEKKKKRIRDSARLANAVVNAQGDKKVKVYHVPAARVHPEEMESVLQEACSQGFEGVMLRRPEFPYEHGKRSFGLLKYKQMHDAEYKIVGFVAGEGKFKGGMGAFVCETKDGLRFHAPPKVSLERRLALWKERSELMGKYVTIQYQELSSQDVPRFPIAKSVRGGNNKQEWL
ncbi:DNA ligase [Strigomonas culicis]|uniref:DNA ligase n=1 Tax=Strigomonas culicis TaxID=28005 RepID=S9W8I9_9TRYP|nr:DNA ligase (ATP) [Strigomonas culicis]EPY35586.1 DNA ligase [Strigomonas culicis]|eukprot:EPY27210.1 DNA ligase (ATP) [Strigomonas culicis]